MMFNHLIREVKNLEYAFTCQVEGGFRYRSMKPSLVKKFEQQACSSTTSWPFFATWLLAQMACSEPKVCLVC